MCIRDSNWIVVKSKFFGRFLMVISAMNVIPREKLRFFRYYVVWKESVSYTHLDVYKRQTPG